MSIRLLALALLLATLPLDAAEPRWIDFEPKGGGYAVQMPGIPSADLKRPGHFSVDAGDASFNVEDDALDPAVREVVASGNRKGIDRILETLRDSMVDAMKASLMSSSAADFMGHPSIIFSFSGVLEGKPFRGAQRVVLTGDRMYMAGVLGAPAALPQADIDRFLGSFRLREAGPATAGGEAERPFRTISYSEMVCGRMPPVPVTFSVPADYVSRAVGQTVEGGCLWGTKDDLDRVTAVPEQGDFSELRRGVVRARVSTNVVCNPATGVFDTMDGAGEAGIRREMQQTGAKVLTWKKETLGGLPALQIVADLGPAGRVYMLYLGNTGFSSNTLLVNYYQPKKRTATDDEIWARLVAGVRKSGGP